MSDQPETPAEAFGRFMTEALTTTDEGQADPVEPPAPKRDLGLGVRGAPQRSDNPADTFAAFLLAHLYDYY